MNVVTILKTKSWIWNGNLRLEGELALHPTLLSFSLKDFPDSHLSFEIPLSNIHSVKNFLLFGIEKNGLHLITKNQKSEYFILENATEFKRILKQQLLQNT